MKYKTIAVATLLLVIGMTSFASAQQVTKDNTPLVKQGSAAFLFGVSGLDNFGLYGPLDDGTASPVIRESAGMKYFFADRMALKFAGTFGTASTGPDSARQTTSTYGLSVGLEWHCHDLYSLSPYLGANLGFKTSSMPTVTQVGKAQGKGGNTIQATGANKTSETGFGGAIEAGFDWFVLPSIALGSEYSLGFSSVSSSVTTNGTEVTQPGAFDFGIIGGYNVHLVVYF